MEPEQTIRVKIDAEIDKFKDLAKVLQSEDWELEAILNILKAYLGSKLGKK